MEVHTFKSTIRSYYRKHGRRLPWRQIKNPYYVAVSEIMLQQTQVSRVVLKYKEFIKCFPTIEKLAHAKQSDVLAVWSGLGYNRRALYIHAFAKDIVVKHKGKIPTDIHTLQSFKGIGKNTAAAIYCFSKNRPAVFIETNIRSVFIHFFFPKRRRVGDVELLPLIEHTLDVHNPREWFYALMDYGVYLKQKKKNPSRKSTHYTKQNKFKGSPRELRGEIVKLLLQKKRIKEADFKKFVTRNNSEIKKALYELEKEEFLIRKRGVVALV